MVDGWYGREYLRRRLGWNVGEMGISIPESTGYGQYTAALEQMRPGAGRVHQAVVEEIKRCAAQARSIPNPVERMKAQVQCAKNIPGTMAGKGFVTFSRRKRSRRKYAPA